MTGHGAPSAGVLSLSCSYSSFCLTGAKAMPAAPQQQITQLLSDWRGGDAGAFDKLIPLVQPVLQQLAHRYMSRERPGHTLQTTILVHDAYLQLADQSHPDWQN